MSGTSSKWVFILRLPYLWAHRTCRACRKKRNPAFAAGRFHRPACYPATENGRFCRPALHCSQQWRLDHSPWTSARKQSVSRFASVILLVQQLQKELDISVVICNIHPADPIFLRLVQKHLIFVIMAWNVINISGLWTLWQTVVQHMCGWFFFTPPPLIAYRSFPKASGDIGRYGSAGKTFVIIHALHHNRSFRPLPFSCHCTQRYWSPCFFHMRCCLIQINVSGRCAQIFTACTIDVVKMTTLLSDRNNTAWFPNWHQSEGDDPGREYIRQAQSTGVGAQFRGPPPHNLHRALVCSYRRPRAGPFHISDATTQCLPSRCRTPPETWYWHHSPARQEAKGRWRRRSRARQFLRRDCKDNLLSSDTTDRLFPEIRLAKSWGHF